MRTMVIAAMREGEKIAVVARLFNIPLRTFFYSTELYRHGGMVRCERTNTLGGRTRLSRAVSDEYAMPARAAIRDNTSVSIGCVRWPLPAPC